MDCSKQKCEHKKTRRFIAIDGDELYCEGNCRECRTKITKLTCLMGCLIEDGKRVKVGCEEPCITEEEFQKLMNGECFAIEKYEDGVVAYLH